ncbi:DUF887-domain-containing protein [Microthyrium microscopicum]|uniref:DUF887-domain-containing protein n=1 Tax=Microthyrium microscopicum TaxID=703497 RepID=A0A6A6U464_9PEZI|nr:DUF887-domain-containing protein [Microthyrium microscopicum]
MTSLVPPVVALQPLWTPVADALNLRALPLHAHEIVIAAGFYHIIFKYLTPWISAQLLSRRYRQFSRKEALDWNLQCVSMVQSILISWLAIWVMKNDGVRAMNSEDQEGRVFGYSGPAGSVQAFATGYFLWDLVVSLQNLSDVGLPVLIHAFSCFTVYLLGFRPVFNYYSCVFVLFELSTPFLNIHLFLEQLGMAGTIWQFINGIMLILVFFFVRLVYGLYFSYHWMQDIWSVSQGQSVKSAADELPESRTLPLWLLGIFIASNTILNALNIVWFGMMIKKIQRRARRAAEKRE